MAEFIGLFGRVADAQAVECIVRKRYCSGGLGKRRKGGLK